MAKMPTMLEMKAAKVVEQFWMFSTFETCVLSVDFDFFCGHIFDYYNLPPNVHIGMVRSEKNIPRNPHYTVYNIRHQISDTNLP